MKELKRTVTAVEGQVMASHNGAAPGSNAGGEDTDQFWPDEPGPAIIPLRRDHQVVSSPLRQARPRAIVDRVEEMEAIRQLALREDVRLLTLVGPAGVGKTRLALEAGDQTAETFPDGVVFIDLTSIRDPAQVLPAIARTHGIGNTENWPLMERLGEYLVVRRAITIPLLSLLRSHAVGWISILCSPSDNLGNLHITLSGTLLAQTSSEVDSDTCRH